MEALVHLLEEALSHLPEEAMDHLPEEEGDTWEEGGYLNFSSQIKSNPNPRLRSIYSLVDEEVKRGGLHGLQPELLVSQR